MSPALLLAIQLSCGLALGLTLVTLLGLAWLRRRRPPMPARWPAVLILRPCEGADPLLEENLLSSATAPYPGPRRVRLLVPGAGDEALPAAEAAARRAPPNTPVEVMVTAVAGCANRKVAQLVQGLAGATEEVIIQVDSDVRLTGSDLLDLVAALLEDPRTGAAFASPVESGPQTPWDRASAALVGASQQNFLALYAVSRMMGGVPSLAGALCAYRREALQRIGGLSPLGAYLGEDYEVARRLVGAGYGVAVSRGPARCTDGGRRLGEVVGRVGRWLLVVRAQRPGLLLAYPLLLAATPVQLLGAALLRDTVHSGLALGLLLARTALALWLHQAHGGPRPWPRALLRAIADVWRAELLLWAGLLRALGSRRITWRGHRYRVAAGGRLVPEPPAGAGGGHRR